MSEGVILISLPAGFAGFRVRSDTTNYDLRVELCTLREPLYMPPIDPMPFVEETWNDADLEFLGELGVSVEVEPLFAFLSRVERYGYELAVMMEDSNNSFGEWEL